MALGIAVPLIKAHRDEDGTWSATLYVDGVWFARMAGFATIGEARAAIRRKYL